MTILSMLYKDILFTDIGVGQNFINFHLPQLSDSDSVAKVHRICDDSCQEYCKIIVFF
ncbi:hypothetical protein NIES3974_25620 [Calothrix sp. NIES-3974]|nr:hypothetical protein NIES3974_25620 [Calothrix sp. NIES-3974]